MTRRASAVKYLAAVSLAVFGFNEVRWAQDRLAARYCASYSCGPDTVAVVLGLVGAVVLFVAVLVAWPRPVLVECGMCMEEIRGEFEILQGSEFCGECAPMWRAVNKLDKEGN